MRFLINKTNHIKQTRIVFLRYRQSKQAHKKVISLYIKIINTFIKDIFLFPQLLNSFSIYMEKLFYICSKVFPQI